MIEIVVLGKNEKFLKKPKKSYDIENSELNQHDFQINHMLFVFSQFKIDGKLNIW